MARVSKDNLMMFLDYGIDLTSRTLELIGSVDIHMTRHVFRRLHALSVVNPESPIEIQLNTDGGDTTQGFAIYDRIKEMQGPVTIIVYGECSSMGVWILQAADKRVMTKNSFLMIHAGEENLEGTPEVVKNWRAYHEIENARMENIFLDKIREKHKDFPRQRLQKMLRTDTILTPQQALDLGLIDEII